MIITQIKKRTNKHTIMIAWTAYKDASKSFLFQTLEQSELINRQPGNATNQTGINAI